MVHRSTLTVLLSAFAVPCLLWCLVVAQSEAQSPSKETTAGEPANGDSPQITENSPATVGEARGRARILHEALHGSLQVMHRDFFREDEGLKIPSRSLEDVFSELSRSYGVQLHWLAVDATAMNIDHEPETEFEKDVVRAIKSGKQEFESVENNRYRFAGRIRLSATCLSCHASRRSSNDDRSAALIISMPLHSEK
jgi:hypothetical protein